MKLPHLHKSIAIFDEQLKFNARLLLTAY